MVNVNLGQKGSKQVLGMCFPKDKEAVCDVMK